MTVKFDEGFTMTIDGKAVPVGATFDVLNPATESVIGKAPDCTREQLDAAIAAARKAFPKWAATPIAERKKALLAMAGVLAQNVEGLKRLLTAEQGKTLDGAAGDVFGGSHWLSQTATLDIPETVNEDSADRKSITRHVPLGVVGAMRPGTSRSCSPASSSVRHCSPATPSC